MFSSNGVLLLLHRGLKDVKKANRYDLVLSPQFYIVKKEQVPVKYSFQAKKLAPSILEDMLPTERGYEFAVEKDGDGWLFYAYLPREIEHFLINECGIEAHKIGKIYFADQLKPVLKKLPIGIDRYSALALVDGFATIVPRSMLEGKKFAKFTEKLRPKKGIKFKPTSVQTKSESIDKSSVILTVLLVIFGMLFILEGYGYKKALQKEQDLMAEAVSNPQLQSKLARDSIKKKYQKIEKEQRGIREALNKLSKLSSGDSVLEKLELKEGTIKAKFGVKKKAFKKVRDLASSLKGFKVITQGFNVILEGAVK